VVFSSRQIEQFGSRKRENKEEAVLVVVVLAVVVDTWMERRRYTLQIIPG
jgi:hypothetical protein